MAEAAAYYQSVIAIYILMCTFHGDKDVGWGGTGVDELQQLLYDIYTMKYSLFHNGDDKIIDQLFSQRTGEGVSQDVTKHIIKKT